MHQDTYEDFVRRMGEERRRLGWTQEEFARKLQITQSHYSKLELWKGRLSYYEMKRLCESEVDSFFIFTGFRTDEIRHLPGEFFADYEYEKLVDCLELVCVLLRQEREQELLIREGKRLLTYSTYALLQGEKGKNVFRRYRRLREDNQNEIAKELGVDVKKLRDLENEKQLPDSELVWKMSNRFQIPYALILKDRKGIIGEIYHLLQLADEKQQQRIVETVIQFHKEKDGSKKGTDSGS